MKQIVLIIFLFMTIGGLAQKYERSIGYRSGEEKSIFYDRDIDHESTYRYMYSWSGKGRKFTAMKIYHRYHLNLKQENVSFFYGYGAHAGYESWNQRYFNQYGNYRKMKTAPIAGLDGLIGLSYDFKNWPVSATADVKPNFDYWGRRYVNIHPFNFGISLIYIF